MAYPLYATTQVLRLGPTNDLYLAGIQDANGNIATATTNYKLRPSGLLIPEQVDENGIPLTTSRITTQITSAVLAASATYTQSPWQDAQALAVNFVSGSVYADEAGTLYVDFSDDGTNVYGTSATTLAFTSTTAGTANGQTLPYPVEIPTRYFRFRYVNGAAAQGTFQLYQTPVSDWSPRTVGLSGSLVPKPYLEVPVSNFPMTLTPGGYNEVTAPNFLGYSAVALAVWDITGNSSTYPLTWSIRNYVNGVLISYANANHTSDGSTDAVQVGGVPWLYNSIGYGFTNQPSNTSDIVIGNGLWILQ